MKFGRIAKFSQPANFRRLRNLLPTTTVHHVATVHPALLTSYAFYFLTPFVPLLVLFLFCPQCNSVCYVILVIFKGGLAIKAPKPSTVTSSPSLIKFIFCGKLLALHPLFLFSHFLLFSLIFSHFIGSKTPSKDDNLEYEWLETFPS